MSKLLSTISTSMFASTFLPPMQPSLSAKTRAHPSGSHPGSLSSSLPGSLRLPLRLPLKLPLRPHSHRLLATLTSSCGLLGNLKTQEYTGGLENALTTTLGANTNADFLGRK